VKTIKNSLKGESLKKNYVKDKLVDEYEKML